MKQRFAIINKLYIFFCLLPLLIQSQEVHNSFVIKNNGDTLLTSKIFEKSTNDDQVTFIMNDSKITLEADKVLSYFDHSLKVRIIVNPDNQRKFVSIILKGDIFLARSISSRDKEIFYILYNKKWTRLDPSLVNLKEQLSLIVPDFSEIISDKKIFYDLVSLGEVISNYNGYKDRKYLKVGKFQFSDRYKFGVYSALGIRFMNIATSNVYLGEAFNSSIGIGTQIRYSRNITGLIRLGYSTSQWQRDNIYMSLKSVDLSPVFSIKLKNYHNNIQILGGVGLKLALDVGSQIESPLTSKTTTKRMAVGYVFQLTSSFDKTFDIFVAYHYMPNQSTAHTGFLNSLDVLPFQTTTIQLGGLYYFKR